MSRLQMGVIAVAMAFAPAAFAQTTPTSPTSEPSTTAPSPTGPAVTNPSTTAPTATAPSMNAPATTEASKAPLPGKNSFTEGQARERIQKAGFNDVKVLKQDENGVWRGDAQKAGAPVKVALDFRGNVVQQ